MTLGARLRQFRLQRRMTMKETAASIGVSLSTYRDWEYGRKVPGDHLAGIAMALKVGVADLMAEQSQARQGVSQAIRLLEKALNLLRTG